MKRKLVLLIGIILITMCTMATVSLTFDSALRSIKTEDYQTARPKLQWLARLGDARAQILLGQMYAYGWGVTRNREEAIRWFRRAAYCVEGVKDVAACEAFSVGMSFEGGLGVKQDLAEATWWFDFAKEGGYFGRNQ